MLKGLDPLLTGDLLSTLAAMGHGDELAIVDANFPATSIGRRLVRLPGVSATHAAEAILSVLPLDDFVAEPCARMQVVGDAERVPEVCQEFARIVSAAEGRSVPMEVVERYAFYERSRQAFAVVQTGERRLYGCLLVTMGVVRPTP